MSRASSSDSKAQGGRKRAQRPGASRRPPAGVREGAPEEFHIGAKIKALRQTRKKTLQEVADETGFSPALISQVENNNVSPPIATLARIAKVLGVRVGYFFRDEGPEEAYEVIRREARPAVTRVISSTGGDHGYTYHALTHRKRDKIMEPFLLSVDAGMRDEQTLYSHEGEEFLLVLEGEAELLLDRERIVLRQGDSVYFESTLRHRLLAHGPAGGAKVLAVLAKGS
ncbi:MAG: XRE family transcriptional regulator [Deferrisomatales bacterium]|nr:XRE family transcriptional regulator [Deferrisomatales bacterium]